MNALHEAIKSTPLAKEYVHLAKPPSATSVAIKGLYQWFCQAMLTFYCPLRVAGREHLPERPFILCSNHNSHMDSAVLMVAARQRFRDYGMVAAADYFFENGFRKHFLGSLMHLIPIDRKPNYNRIVELVVGCREFIKTGSRSLIIFPEGTRSRSGKMQRFKRGPAMISRELALPIVPAYVDGTFQALPKGRFFLRPRKVHVFFGNPLFPHEVNSQSSNGTLSSAYKLITLKLRAAILKLEASSHASR